MIFEKDYDTTLYYLMKADKKNRNELIDLINNLPKELIESIKISLQKLENKEFLYDKESSNIFQKNSKTNNHIFFYYQIDEDKALTISKEYNDGKTCKTIFKIIFFPINHEYIKECMNNFEDEWLGTITSNKDNYIEENEREYNLYKTPIGNFISYNKKIGKNKRNITIFKSICSKKDIDLELSVKDIKTKGTKKLIR